MMCSASLGGQVDRLAERITTMLTTGILRTARAPHGAPHTLRRPAPAASRRRQSAALPNPLESPRPVAIVWMIPMAVVRETPVPMRDSTTGPSSKVACKAGALRAEPWPQRGRS